MSHERPPPASRPRQPWHGAAARGQERGEKSCSSPGCLAPPLLPHTSSTRRLPQDTKRCGIPPAALIRGWGDGSAPPVQCGDTVVPPVSPGRGCLELPSLCPPLSDSSARMGPGGCLPKCVFPTLQAAEGGAGPAQGVLPGAGGATGLPFSMRVFTLIW